jgi:glycine/D-amino acid oxidase-like deaminating enzyme/nitrite reductase/ring-hydroxylating ferredoxin subunit
MTESARPRSIWLSNAPAIETDATPPGDAEVAVVGAGLTGLAVGVMLARAGRGVVVLEARQVGAVTTGNTTGKLSLLQGQVLSGIRERNGDDPLRRYVYANRAAQDWLLGELEDVPDAATSADAVTYATTPEGDAILREERAAAVAGGLNPDLLTGDGLESLRLPFPVSSAIRLESQWQLHPMPMLAKLVRTLRASGGSIVEGARVVGVDLVEHGAVVRTTAGEVRARTVVLATGTPILDRGLFFAKLEPSRSLAAAYTLDGVAAPNGMFLSVDEPHRSLRTADPAAQGVLVVGGESFFPGRTESVRALLARLDEWTAEWFGAASRISWWAAQDYRTFTRLPFAAAMPRGGGRIYAATGYNKWGMTNAVAAAQAITAAVTGTDADIAAFSSQPGLRAAGEAVGANAEIARQLATRWAQSTKHADTASEGRIVRSGASPVAESTIEGVTCRVSAVCTHLGGVVEWNDAERTWDCPLHGSRFSPTGERLEGPAVKDLAPAD